jgi:serine/threonine-protein kinase RsbW
MRAGPLILAIESALDHVCLVGAAVRGVAAAAGLDALAAAQVELAVVEGVNNAIEHAYRGRPGQPVEVALGVVDHCLTIEIADRGLAMEWDRAYAAATARLDADPLADGGRGLVIMHQTMDEVGYRSHAGRNVLRLTKRIADPGAAEGATPAAAARRRR